MLVDIFWKLLISSESASLTQTEALEIKKAKEEFSKGETIKWENLK
ncbi:MAG: hypothetical protein HZA78_01075 [Candidatus Schekmanbacteria bacterium]|nr:hypothetical protein [Candidatus Schekmanbacteria bacterium]